jgi:integrase
MARDRKGSIVERGGKIYARITFIDEKGKRQDIWQRAENRTHAKELNKQLLRRLEATGDKSIDAEKMTFSQLADYYDEHYLLEAKYVDGRKVEGYRSVYDFKKFLAVLRDFFGRKRLRSLTYGDIKSFKSTRLNTPTRQGTQRSIASVHRELALLRRMLNVAHAEGFIHKNPFNAGKSLISLADERKRERVISREEEARLLAACVGPRAHLRPIIIAAMDTGCRQGELFKLQWKDVDLENRIIRIVAFNTKTLTERQIAMTVRVAHELERLWEISPKRLDGLVFGVTDNVKRSFTAVRRETGLMDLRFHDLRHVCATRLVAAHIPLSEVGRVLGHQQPSTTYRYANLTQETAKRAAAALDLFNGEA